jgi:DNA-binding response OmpR family regulator
MKKILLIEDEESVQEMLKQFLEHSGHLVIAASTGKAGLEWAKESRLDLAIVDLGLPDMPGMEVCRLLKEDPKTSGFPIIILTGNSSNEAKITANLEAKAELFLNKPISVEDLKNAVNMIFESSEKKKLLLRNSIRNRLGY